jgi:hypothetical protein
MFTSSPTDIHEGHSLRVAFVPIVVFLAVMFFFVFVFLFLFFFVWLFSRADIGSDRAIRVAVKVLWIHSMHT